MFVTMTVYHPHYGPHGEPYSVRSRFADRTTLSHHWTERDAMEARDQAFDAGAHGVHVAGLPLRSAAVGPVSSGPLPEVKE